MRRWLIPAAFLLLQRAILGGAAFATGTDPFAAAAYARWDSAYYLDIAARGYAPLFHCPPESHYAADQWCGNAGWFPGFAWALKAVAAAGVPLGAAAALVPLFAQFAVLLLLWRCLYGDWLLLGIGALFFGNVYLAAAFPVSLFLLAALCCLTTARPGVAAASGGVAALCYPTGILLAPVALLWGFVRRRRESLKIALGAVAGFAAVLCAMRLQAGDWLAYFKTQQKYGYGASLGIDALFSHLKPLVNARYRDAKGFATAVQTLLATALAIYVVLRARKSLASDRDSLVVIYFLAFWLAPLMLGGHLSLYRAEALLLPAVLLLRDLAPALKVALLAVLAVLSYAMAALFFTSVLV